MSISSTTARLSGTTASLCEQRGGVGRQEGGNQCGTPLAQLACWLPLHIPPRSSPGSAWAGRQRELQAGGSHCGCSCKRDVLRHSPLLLGSRRVAAC